MFLERDLTMRTPAGKECRFYYEDYNRGRNLHECRLIKSNPESLPWQPKYCEHCPVPDITCCIDFIGH